MSPPAQTFSGTKLNYGDDVWCLYKQPEDIGTPKRPSHAALTATEYAKLLRTVHESILVYCGSRGKVAAYHLLGLFQDYLIWKDDLPIEIGNIDNNPLPHVLFLQ